MSLRKCPTKSSLGLLCLMDCSGMTRKSLLLPRSSSWVSIKFQINFRWTTAPFLLHVGWESVGPGSKVPQVLAIRHRETVVCAVFPRSFSVHIGAVRGQEPRRSGKKFDEAIHPSHCRQLEVFVAVHFDQLHSGASHGNIINIQFLYRKRFYTKFSALQLRVLFANIVGFCWIIFLARKRRQLSSKPSPKANWRSTPVS